MYHTFFTCPVKYPPFQEVACASQYGSLCVSDVAFAFTLTSVHMSVHMCKNRFEPEMKERAVLCNLTLTTPNFEGTIIRKLRLERLVPTFEYVNISPDII